MSGGGLLWDFGDGEGVGGYCFVCLGDARARLPRLRWGAGITGWGMKKGFLLVANDTEDVGANKSRLGSSPVNTMRPMTVKFLCHLWSYLKCERRLTLTPYPISRLMV